MDEKKVKEKNQNDPDLTPTASHPNSSSPIQSIRCSASSPRGGSVRIRLDERKMCQVRFERKVWEAKLLMKTRKEG